MKLGGTRVMVTGGAGFSGRRIAHKLTERGATPVVVRAADYGPTEPRQPRAALEEAGADYVVRAAAVVGGIGAIIRKCVEGWHARQDEVILWGSARRTGRASTRAAITSAREQLDRERARILGGVLNGPDASLSQMYYSY